MKVLLAIAGVLVAVHQVVALGDEMREAFGAICGDLSRRDCIKNIRSCRRLNTAMMNEMGNSKDILNCTRSLGVSIDRIVEAFSKFSNGEGDVPTLESMGVTEGLMKDIRKCILSSKGLLDKKGNLDKAAMEASVEATLHRVLGPDQHKLLNAMMNAKQKCGKPTIHTMKKHRDCMNQICVDNINA